MQCFGAANRFFERRRGDGDVAHLTARRSLALIVQVKFRGRIRQDLGPIGLLPIAPKIAEEVNHRGWRERHRAAKRQAAHGADVLLKLAGFIGVESLVAAVVRSRSQFIHDDPSVLHEHLYSEEADEADLLGDAERQGTRELYRGSGQ